MKKLIGTNLGQYEIVEKIGQGGMAYVFKAYQASLDRYVALKILSPILAEQPGFTERFQREAHSVARLHHPNILQVYDFGVQDHYNYLVMRYVQDSVTLSHLIRQEVSLDKLLDYILQVADALNYAHEHGVIHRDVKPSNILIDNKWALLSDFGLVKMIEDSTHLTNTGMGIGTPAYMSPEQVNNSKQIDRRTDIYALGIIMYRLLTGTIPHDAPTPIAVLAKRGSEPVLPLRQVKPTISVGFEQVTMRSLAMEPDMRYSTATDFAEALKQAQTNPDYQEPTLTITEQPTVVSELHHPDKPGNNNKPHKNKMALIVGGSVAALLLLGLILFFFSNGSSAANGPTPQTNTPGSSAGVVEVSPTATPVPPTATPVPPGTPSAMAHTDLAVYAGPGENYDLIGYLPEGASAEITSRDQERAWWQIKTSLSPDGSGWISAEPEFTQAVDSDNIPIALAPPTPTPSPTETPPSDTPTATPTSPPHTPTPTDTPTRPPATATPTTVSSGSTAPPIALPTPTVPTGKFTLLTPISLEQPTFGLTEFEWRWSSPLPADQGFEVRIWRDGEPPTGVHNAVLDNKNGTIEALGNNRYRLVADITDAFGVKGRGGEYNWTVAVVQIEPVYQDLGIQAPPARLRFDVPGGGGGGGDDGDGGGGGGGGINP